METERLYYRDSYLIRFTARVLETREDGRMVYLDRTAFYPTSGGQPHDLGTLNGISVVDVVDEETRIAHRLGAPLAPGEVTGEVDWARRFDHMQQHTGQHLLSAVAERLLGARTTSVHFGPETATVELAVETLDQAQIREIEIAANAAVMENIPVTVSFELAGSAEGLRRPSGREGPLRIVTIAGLDRSACGGTHVRATGEIGMILLRRMERIRKQVRLEFLCGLRAVRRVRADYDVLAALAAGASSAAEDLPAVVEKWRADLRGRETEVRELAAEVDRYRAEELRRTARRTAGGIRVVTWSGGGSSVERLRGLGQAVTAEPLTLFIGALETPPTVVVAIGSGSGLDAGLLLKPLLTECGGKGGGNSRMAQGTVPSPEALARLVARLGAMV